MRKGRCGLLRIPAVMGLSTLALATTASAEPQTEQIQGNWTFKSTIVGCTFDGTAFIAEELDGNLSCELTAHQVCHPNVTSLVRQICTVGEADNQILIDSTIVERLGGNYRGKYWPDNFVLKIIDENRMEGIMSSSRKFPAVWTREESSTS